MIIEKINWLSFEAKEAELLVTDGTYSCYVFCHPCEYSVGDELTSFLHAFMTKDVMISYSDTTSLERVETSFKYSCVARVSEISSNKVTIGGIFIELDSDIPSGINNGDYINFHCSRLDLW